MAKVFGPFFLVISSVTNPKEQKWKGPQANFELLKTQTFKKKKQPFQWKKIWPFFPVLSSMITLREQNIKVHKVFWQLLWKK